MVIQFIAKDLPVIGHPHDPLSVQHATVDCIDEEAWFRAVRGWIEVHHRVADEVFPPTLFAFDMSAKKMKVDHFIPTLYKGHAYSECLDIEWRARIEPQYELQGHPHEYHPTYIYLVYED